MEEFKQPCNNCQPCNCQNQNNDPTPKEIGEFIKDVSDVTINLKNSGILSQETIDHANRVAITALDKVKEILENIDAKKVANGDNKDTPPTEPIEPIPPVYPTEPTEQI